MAATLKSTPILKGNAAKDFVKSLDQPKINSDSKDFLKDCASFLKKVGK